MSPGPTGGGSWDRSDYRELTEQLARVADRLATVAERLARLEEVARDTPAFRRRIEVLERWRTALATGLAVMAASSIGSDEALIKIFTHIVH
jgi:hypothetical protein